MERSGMIKSAAILEQIGSGIEGCNDKRIWLAIAELLFQSDWDLSLFVAPDIHYAVGLRVW